MRHKLLLTLLLTSNFSDAAPPALTPPADEVVNEAKSLVESFKQKERGPYSRLRWFCNDGTVHPPTPYPCAERGGGIQHAEYSVDRNRLAELGWPVGTVVAALTWEEIWQPEQRHRRLRALPLEHYMEAVDDGWVLRKALNYRGRVQLEDEELNGRNLLLKLIQQADFLREDFLLARELTRSIPHGTPSEDRTRTIRHHAEEIAEMDSAFTKLRIEIHSKPSAGTAKRVRDWLAVHAKSSTELNDKARMLADELDQLYGLSGRKLRLERMADTLAKRSPTATNLIRQAQAAPSARRIELLSRAMEQLRRDATEKQPATTLLRLDLQLDLAAELRTSALERLETPLTRRELLVLARDLLRASWSLGLLSAGERDALTAPVDGLLTSQSVDAAEYAFATRRLSLAAGWSAQSARYTFAEPLVLYNALDSKAERFVDDLLRDSVLLPLGEAAHRLAMDGAQAAAIGHRIFGETAGGLLGINPGVAKGRLRILDPQALAGGAQGSGNEVVVLTETVAELEPVAGILTLGEGNPLSHVQMLARNLGIPNAVISPRLLPRLQAHAGKEVVLAVAGDGRVLLEQAADSAVPADKAPEPAPNVRTVSAPQPDLSQTDPLPLAALHAGLSGRVVGPKAANVGQLNRLFPGRISSAIALPFGIFAEHTTVPRQRLTKAFERYRAGNIDQSAFDAELDEVRQMVAAVSLNSDLVDKLHGMMKQEFGAGEGYGLFVRSDTNAEDLPEFTGAGLNQTLPNVVGLEKQLSAVSKVWSSVYTRRAMAWRSRILSNPEAVYASVLLMKSVPSEKSGVLVTADLATGGPGLTVSVAWGVGGAVDNESAASRVLRPDGTSLLLAEAKAPYRRALAAEGGISWLPAAAGPVLTEAEMVELRRLAAEVVERFPPVRNGSDALPPWDIEFAFAEGKLWLLQIRPLIQRGRVEADAVVDAHVPRNAASGPSGRVSLDSPPDMRIEGGM